MRRSPGTRASHEVVQASRTEVGEGEPGIRDQVKRRLSGQKERMSSWGKESRHALDRKGASSGVF